MHLEIFGEENISLINLMMDMRFYVEDLPAEKKEKAIGIIIQAFEDIKNL